MDRDDQFDSISWSLFALILLAGGAFLLRWPLLGEIDPGKNSFVIVHLLQSGPETVLSYFNEQGHLYGHLFALSSLVPYGTSLQILTGFSLGAAIILSILPALILWNRARWIGLIWGGVTVLHGPSLLFGVHPSPFILHLFFGVATAGFLYSHYRDPDRQVALALAMISGLAGLGVSPHHAGFLMSILLYLIFAVMVTGTLETSDLLQPLLLAPFLLLVVGSGFILYVQLGAGGFPFSPVADVLEFPDTTSLALLGSVLTASLLLILVLCGLGFTWYYDPHESLFWFLQMIGPFMIAALPVWSGEPRYLDALGLLVPVYGLAGVGVVWLYRELNRTFFWCFLFLFFFFIPGLEEAYRERSWTPDTRMENEQNMSSVPSQDFSFFSSNP